MIANRYYYRHLLPVIVLLAMLSTSGYGQELRPAILAKKITTPIVLDGILDDAAWASIIPTSDFYQYFPSDSLAAKNKTEIYLAYDEQNIYVAAKCFAKGGDFSANSLKRDYSFSSGDNISFLFDTYSDKTNAFMFGMNSYGVRREALVVNGGRSGRDFDSSWDNKWDGESTRHADYFICEFAIPLKTIRYSAGATSWRINAYRHDFQDYEISSLTPIPANNILADLTFMTELQWESPLGKSGPNVSLIPYLSGGIQRDFENLGETEFKKTGGIGGDAKIAITSGLNLDLTINPDFSQVEVDRQVTNLDRFEISFPERRQFFLENADLFGLFGSGRSNPFFSRRIGISTDTTTDENIQNAIRYGVRLSGKLNEKLRTGLINIQTAAQRENDLPSFNYSVLAGEQRIFERSAIAFIFVNKQAIHPERYGETYDPYNRIGGLEYRLSTSDNVWNGKITYHHAFTAVQEKHPFSSTAFINYNKRNFEFEYFQNVVGNGFDAQVGFVPRKDIYFIRPEVTFKFYPQGKIISNMQLSLEARLTNKIGADDHIIVPDFRLIEKSFQLSKRISFSNSARFNAELEHENILLLDDFDPTKIQEDTIFLKAGSQHTNSIFRVNYRSDNRKSFYYSFRPLISKFYSGDRFALSGELGYRFQPFGSISLKWNYNYITLGEPFEPAQLWLVGPRIDLTFTKKLFFTTFIQYNNQEDNVNINARFQWRFRPVSDFFLVYTDNFFSEDFSQFSVRNRGLVAKLTYWFTL